MDKLRDVLHPYTFRNRMLLVLLISSMIAGFISLASSFVYSMINVREEVALNQHAVAIYMLELDQVTDMSVEEIIDLIDTDILSVKASIANRSMLDDTLSRKIDETVIATYAGSIASLPITYLKLGDYIVALSSSSKLSLLTISLFRISSAVITFFLVFMLMSWLSSRSIAKPVTQLTQATRLVSDGDFSVKLPQNIPGEVGELMRSFNSMTEALDRTSYLQKDFISSISHEFRTPIASIRGFARLLQMDGLDETTKREYVDMIAQESDRLSRLSETILRLSALEQQAAPACLNEFRLDEQLRQVILRLEPAWSAKNIDWQLDLQPVSIKSDGELLIQAWTNLLQNAVKFSSESGLIEVSLVQEDDVVITITDHGPGMSEETIGRIFDRFFQADHSRSNQGVGLGLCLTKRILDILQGSITVTSTLGEGSTFRIALPHCPLTTLQTRRIDHE